MLPKAESPSELLKDKSVPPVLRLYFDLAPRNPAPKRKGVQEAPLFLFLYRVRLTMIVSN